MLGRLIPVVCVTAAVVPFSGRAMADVTRDQAARLGVDVILVRGGGELRGSILSRAEDGALIVAVRREWLRDREPARLDAEQQRALTERSEAREQLVDRIREWLGELDGESELAAILRTELEEYEEFVQNPDQEQAGAPSEFLIVELPANEVRRTFAQPPERKQIALVAWQHQLTEVEETSVLELREQLEERQVDWRNASVDLSDRLPTAMPQSEQEWAARRAIYEFAFGDPIEFQGTGEMVFRTDEDGEQPELEQVLGGLLGGDLNRLLGGNGPGAGDKRPGWRESAIRSAEGDGAAGFRVTRVETDLENSRVVVETEFIARVAEESWETIWGYRAALDASEERDALADRIRQDPQVAESFKLLESLGLEAGVNQALQFGAATMEAQQTADDRFFEFFDRYTQRLDGPPLRWSGMGQE